MGVKVVVDRESVSDEIEFELMKPVWRMNVVPSDFGGFVMYENHGRVMDKSNSSALYVDDYYFDIKGDGCDIAYYQTNRTKAAKYEWVDCGCKNGVFYLPSIEGGYYEPHLCGKCNGKGYRLEAIK